MPKYSYIGYNHNGFELRIYLITAFFVFVLRHKVPDDLLFFLHHFGSLIRFNLQLLCSVPILRNERFASKNTTDFLWKSNCELFDAEFRCYQKVGEFVVLLTKESVHIGIQDEEFVNNSQVLEGTAFFQAELLSLVFPSIFRGHERLAGRSSAVRVNATTRFRVQVAVVHIFLWVLQFVQEIISHHCQTLCVPTTFAFNVFQFDFHTFESFLQFRL